MGYCVEGKIEALIAESSAQGEARAEVENESVEHLFSDNDSTSQESDALDGRRRPLRQLSVDTVKYQTVFFTLLKRTWTSQTTKILHLLIFQVKIKCIFELNVMSPVTTEVCSAINYDCNHLYVTSAISMQPLNSLEGPYNELSNLALYLFWKDHCTPQHSLLAGS